MSLKILTSSALVLMVASSALADPLTLTVNPRGARIITVYSSVQSPAEDAILPNGNINMNQTLIGSTNRSPIRIQCDSSPTTSVMRTNTFDAPPNSDCP